MGRFGNFRDGEIWDEHVRGWVPPGYDNLGPGNEVRIGPAGRSAADVDARDHDIDYGNEEATGVNPYVNWVEADEEFINGLPIEGPSTAIAKGLFSAKKAAKRVGLLGDMSGKAKRKNPWEEGEEYRKEREARKKRHEDNWRTRDQAWAQARAEMTALPPDNPMDWEETKDNSPPLPDLGGSWAEVTTHGDGTISNWDAPRNRNAFDAAASAEAERARAGAAAQTPLSNSSGSGTTMDVVQPTAAPAAAARASTASSGNPVSKETEISIYPNLSYGLPETHTCILPWTGWLSVAKLKTNTPCQLRIRMNSPNDMLDVTTNNSGTTIAQGFYNQPIKEDGTLATAVDSDGVSFPDTFNSLSTTTVERPAWRAYFGALYEYYTVLGCEYKITINNPVATVGASVIVGTQFDSYSDTAGQTGNVMPQTSLSQAMAYKHMKWEIIQYSRSEVPNRNNAVISGRYTPGQVKRNIQNDGDVKTWTSTGARDLQGTNTDTWANPVLKDFLTLNFYKAPLGWSNAAGANMQIELKYIVQFKDLRQQARYPNSITTDQTIVQTLGHSTTAVGNAYQRWA